MAINKEALFKKLEYTPHSEYQQMFHDSATRFRVACCGRRFGKTQMAAHEMTYALMDISKPEAWYWIVGPNYKLGEKEFRVVLRDLTKLGIIHQCKVSNNVKTGDMTVTMPWKTKLEVVSADKKDGLQGEGLSGVIMSEAATHDSITWEQYIRPALTDFKGWAIFPSTPKGFNWFYYLWTRSEDNDHDQWESWRFPSWYNPIVFPGGFDDPEITQVRNATSPQWFQQEYGAQFTSYEGKIYDEFDESIHVTDIEYNPIWRNYWVMDFGFSNPFVCLDIMVDASDNIYVWREYYKRYLSTWEHGRALRERESPKGFHVDSMFGDPRGADEIATLALVLGAVWGRPVPWKQGVEAVKRQLKVQPDGKPKLYIDRSCVNMIREMHALRSKEISQSDRNPKEGQHDYDDHACDALRYFCSEFFVLGAGSSLADAYSEDRNVDPDTYFRYDTGFNLNDAIGF